MLLLGSSPCVLRCLVLLSAVAAETAAASPKHILFLMIDVNRRFPTRCVFPASPFHWRH